MSEFEIPTTECRNKNSETIDEADTLSMLRIINEEDKTAAIAVEKALPSIAVAVDLIAERLGKGGRLFYVGAGTSGRLGVLDAAECPPTYGTDENMVRGIIAGGTAAMFRSQEGAEDDEEQAATDLKKENLCAVDVVVAVAASGRTPYAIGALKYAKNIGAAAIAVSCAENPKMRGESNISIELVTGAEVITGSTRMKAGTAQKMTLNMISTCTMIKLGKVYGNLMVDVKATNEKLKDRARRIVEEIAGCTADEADAALLEANGSAKLAVLVRLFGVTRDEAETMLNENGGMLRAAIKANEQE